jgi:lysylphosphatidylglycerol synthase-like protein
MSASTTGAVPAARPAPSGGPVAVRGLLRLGLGLLVSGAILAYLFVAQGVDPRAIVPLLRGISLPGLLAYVAISASGLVLRALRYRLLLGRAVPFWPLVLVTAVRNMAVDLVPARAGAVASYLYLVTARLGLPLEAGVASFALSFILDTLAVAPLLVLALLVVGQAPLSPAILVGGSLVILLGSVAALWVLAPILRVGAIATGRLPGPAGRLVPLLRAAAGEVERRERGRTLVPALGLSLLLRLTKYAAYYCLLQALLGSSGQAGPTLGFFRVFLSVAGAELAASLPLPTVMSVGPYEAAGAAGFAFWLGLPRELATLAVTAFHGLSQVHDYGLGLLALVWIMAAPPRRPADAGPDTREARSLRDA